VNFLYLDQWQHLQKLLEFLKGRQHIEVTWREKLEAASYQQLEKLFMRLYAQANNKMVFNHNIPYSVIPIIFSVLSERNHLLRRITTDLQNNERMSPIYTLHNESFHEALKKFMSAKEYDSSIPQLVTITEFVRALSTTTTAITGFGETLMKSLSQSLPILAMIDLGPILLDFEVRSIIRLDQIGGMTDDLDWSSAASAYRTYLIVVYPVHHESLAFHQLEPLANMIASSKVYFPESSGNTKPSPDDFIRQIRARFPSTVELAVEEEQVEKSQFRPMKFIRALVQACRLSR